MANIGFVDAFSKFGAKLDNPMWAVSAIAQDGALVISCWEHYFKKGGKGILQYVDSLGRWNGNDLGNNLLKIHISKAFSDSLPVKVVVATAKDTNAIDYGNDASNVKKTFHVREDLVGKVIAFDGDNFIIEFKKF